MNLLFVQFSLQEIRSSVKYIIILLIYSFCCVTKFVVKVDIYSQVYIVFVKCLSQGTK